MNNATKNIERFNLLNTSIMETEKRIREERSEKKALFETILKENKDLIENSLCKWVEDNPIEAIGYILTSNNNSSSIFYKNSHGYIDLFDEDIAEDNKEDIVYRLFNKESLKSISFKQSEVIEHFSTLKNKNNMSLKLDFLNNYEIHIIRDIGRYKDEHSWEIDFYIFKNEISQKYILDILEKNYSVIVQAPDRKNINFSNDGVIELSKEHSFKLFCNLKDSENTVVILDGDTPVGLLEFSIIENSVIYIDNIEIVEKYQDLGYGSSAILTLQKIFNLAIEGYSKPDDDVYAFWSNLGAIFGSCEECCDDYEECGGFGCDNPYDYQFEIEV